MSKDRRKQRRRPPPDPWLLIFKMVVGLGQVAMVVLKIFWKDD